MPFPVALGHPYRDDLSDEASHVNPSLSRSRGQVSGRHGPDFFPNRRLPCGVKSLRHQAGSYSSDQAFEQTGTLFASSDSLSTNMYSVADLRPSYTFTTGADAQAPNVPRQAPFQNCFSSTQHLAASDDPQINSSSDATVPHYPKNYFSHSKSYNSFTAAGSQTQIESYLGAITSCHHDYSISPVSMNRSFTSSPRVREETRHEAMSGHHSPGSDVAEQMYVAVESSYPCPESYRGCSSDLSFTSSHFHSKQAFIQQVGSAL